MPVCPGVPPRGFLGRQGFSLIELMATILIIAVLAGLLLPMLWEIQALSKRTVCQSNLRQWGIASLGYAQDHRGQVPYSITYWDGPRPDFGKTTYAAWKVPKPGYGDELTYATMLDYLEGDPSKPNTLAKVWTCPTGELAAFDQTTTPYPCLFMDYSWFALRESPRPSWSNAPDEIMIRRARPSQVLAGDTVYRSMFGIWGYAHGKDDRLTGTTELVGFPGANQLFGDGHVRWRPAKEWPVSDMRYKSNGGRYLGDNNNNRAYF